MMSRAEALRDEATAHGAKGRYAEAERLAHEALALRKRGLGSGRSYLVALLVNLTSLLRR